MHEPREDPNGQIHAVMSEAIRLQEGAVTATSKAFEQELGKRVVAALELILATIHNGDDSHSARGRVIVGGIGKSGLIARKIAATLASTGTPAHFLHAGEANHGDLGMIARHDVLLLLSNSGEAAELHNLLTYAKRFSIPVIAITGDEQSTLARAASVSLVYPKWQEACPLRLAPTTSTLQQLVIGDMIAIGLMHRQGFSAEDFRVFHPGGKLGAQLTRIGDLMHAGGELPLIAADAVMSEALIEMTSKSFGCVGVTGEQGTLAGIFTDGDLRRHMSASLLDTPVHQVMTRDPVTTSPDALAVEALAQMNAKSITSLFVIENNRPVGIVHIHDLLRAGVQ